MKSSLRTLCILTLISVPLHTYGTGLLRALYKTRRVVPYATITTVGGIGAYVVLGKKKAVHTHTATSHTPKSSFAKATADRAGDKSANTYVPTNLQWAYQTFHRSDAHTSHPKPLSGRFTSTFTGTYPNSAELVSSYDDFITLGLPTTHYKKTYDRVHTNADNRTHTVHASGYIQCKAGDTHCNNALYALSNSRDFTRCMHAALSHPEIARTQRCESLFSMLGKYGLGNHALRQPLCKNSNWTFDVELDHD